MILVTRELRGYFNRCKCRKPRLDQEPTACLFRVLFLQLFLVKWLQSMHTVDEDAVAQPVWRLS